MEFETGDKVHVTRLGGKEVDFYATIGDFAPYGEMIELANCTNKSSESVSAYLPNNDDFGPNKTDYYTLATDEEDTEEPVIQRINDTVNHPSHYNFGDIEVVDFIEQVTKHYNSDVAYHIGNAIKYISRAPHKNGKEDIAKAKWYIERAFDKWE